jgi:phenylalanyl-tRNA synthetase beta subunit
MQLSARSENSNILVSVPPTRSDILHKCDVMEVFVYVIYCSIN